MNNLLHAPVLMLVLLAAIVVLLNLYRNHRSNERRGSTRQAIHAGPELEFVHLIGEQLRWEQPSIAWGDYELHARNNVVAILHFHNSWGVSTVATGETAQGCWTIRLAGLWPRSLAIKNCAGVKQGRFTFTDGSQGTVEFTDGRTLRFVRLARHEREFQTASGEPVVRFTSTPGAARRSSTVVIQPSAANISELPWILMLGWYVLALARYR